MAKCFMPPSGNQIVRSEGRTYTKFIVMSLHDIISNYSSKNGGNVGYNNTVKDQVDTIEANIDAFKRTLESQRKQQGEIQFSIKKLEEETKTSFHDLHKEISERVAYLTELFKSDSRNQSKQFQYLELQNSKLHEEHDSMSELATMVSSRTGECENNVGL